MAKKMNKYKYTEKCNEISGFGGSYEEGCCKMVIAGLEWFDAHPDADPKFHVFKNLFGLVVENNKDAEALTKHMNTAINGEATGAMMQACMDHVMFAKHHGWDKYIEMMEKRENDIKT